MNINIDMYHICFFDETIYVWILNAVYHVCIAFPHEFCPRIEELESWQRGHCKVLPGCMGQLFTWTRNSSDETQPRRHDSGKQPPGAQSQLFPIHGHVGRCWRYRPPRLGWVSSVLFLVEIPKNKKSGANIVMRIVYQMGLPFFPTGSFMGGTSPCSIKLA